MNRFKLTTELDVKEAVLEIEYHHGLTGSDGWNSPRWTARQWFPASDWLAIYEAYEHRTEITLTFGTRYKGPAVIVGVRQEGRAFELYSIEVVWRGVGPLVAA